MLRFSVRFHKDAQLAGLCGSLGFHNKVAQLAGSLRLTEIYQSFALISKISVPFV